MPAAPTLLQQLAAHPGSLEQVSVDKIRVNPENPRIFFRPNELEELQESIARYGVQVPISVFRRGHEYILLDGERRWRCASKLNHKTIPALVQHDPGQLGNLLLMFNIHALREQWDTLTVALKLPSIIELLTAELGYSPGERELSQYTGLPRGTIRKCRSLMALPQKYKNLLLDELRKPKGKEGIGEEFFLEMEKALRSVGWLIPDTDLDAARDALIAKYRSGVIVSNIEFRKLGKIARSAYTVGADQKAATKAIKRVLSDSKYSIQQAWEATASEAYAERDVSVRIEALLARLDRITPDTLDEGLKKQLAELVRRIQRILAEAKLRQREVRPGEQAELMIVAGGPAFEVERGQSALLRVGDGDRETSSALEVTRETLADGALAREQLDGDFRPHEPVHCQRGARRRATPSQSTPDQRRLGRRSSDRPGITAALRGASCRRDGNAAGFEEVWCHLDGISASLDRRWSDLDRTTARLDGLTSRLDRSTAILHWPSSHLGGTTANLDGRFVPSRWGHRSLRSPLVPSR